MDTQLYKRTLYTKKVRFIINEIYEYDIAKANISILLQAGIIKQREYDMFSQMTKYQREVTLGCMQKTPLIREALKEGFKIARKKLIDANHLTEDDIVSIKKDAFYTLRRLDKTTFGHIDFTLRNQYDIYIYCRGIEIYYGLNEFDEGVMDIKGISDGKLQYHEAYVSFIAYILKLVIKNNVDMAIQELMSFIQKYDNRELELDYYREFNAESMFRIGNFGMSFLDEAYKSVVSIENNQMFNRELFSILMDIQYKK